MIQIGLIEDHLLLRHHLRRLLEKEKDFNIAFETNSHDQAALIENLRLFKIDSVVLDISMSQHDGLNLLQLLKDRAPHSRIIVLTSYAIDEYTKKAIELGASAVIVKDNLFKDLIPTIRFGLVKDE